VIVIALALEPDLIEAKGEVPDLTALPPGCPFEPRCPFAHDSAVNACPTSWRPPPVTPPSACCTTRTGLKGSRSGSRRSGAPLEIEPVHHICHNPGGGL